jgi:hypothetical protein
MTPKQLRALDALLGREVMGYNVQPLANYLVGSMRDDGYNYCTVNEHGDPGVLPAFTTSLDAAMMLVERVLLGVFNRFELYRDSLRPQEWVVTLSQVPTYNIARSAASTPALAVSLAVCEACGIKIKEESNHEP